jgi:NADH-quinone oxidoreductase subunit G
VSDTVAEPTRTTLSVVLNGTSIEAEPGELLIDAAERNGVYIPRFCYHPRMKPVGMCRMCIVEVDTGRGPALQPACMLECAPDMVVETESPVTKKAQDGILEFLLINHPLDCPVCDKGGECPLQDQTMAYGPGESRFVEEKRHFEKPIPISDLVLLDRERCILCDRCTRFAKDVAGDPLISFIDRGNQTEVNTFPDDPFASYFSGNTVQICPVGALTAKPYRFKARPWDLAQVESTCTSCSVGCRVAVQTSRNEVLRYQGVDIDPVNWGWLCDKGRFGFEAVQSDGRLGEPLVRDDDGELAPARWSDALAAAAAAVEGALQKGGPSALAVIGGSRLTNEDAYAWSKLAKGVLGTDNVDAQLGDGLPGDVVLGLPSATIDDLCRPGGTVLLVGPDLKEELGILYLRLRHAAVNDDVTIVEISPRSTGLSAHAALSLHPRPGALGELVRAIGTGHVSEDVAGVAQADIERAVTLLDGGFDVLLGRASLAESAAPTVDAASAIREHYPDARFVSALRRANVRGALDMGLAPGLLPGRVSLEGGRSWFATAWPTIPDERGLDTQAILEAAAEGRIETLVLLGADLADFPDRDLAQRGLAGASNVIALDRFVTETSAQADVVFPVAGFAECDGTTTNLEGRVSTVARAVTPPGTARSDWMIAADLAFRMGHDLGLESVEAITDEIARMAPSHVGLTRQILDSPLGRDGVVVPVVDLEALLAAVPQITTSEGTVVHVKYRSRQVDEGPPPVDDVVPDEAPDAESVPVVDERPALLTFDGADPMSPPPVDAYALRLVAGRRMYDLGIDLGRSPGLADLAPGSVVSVNPYDFDRLGVADGDHVRVSSSRDSVVVEVVADHGVPRGTGAMHFNQPGICVAELIVSGSVVTEIRVETAEGGD